MLNILILNTKHWITKEFGVGRADPQITIYSQDFKGFIIQDGSGKNTHDRICLSTNNYNELGDGQADGNGYGDGFGDGRGYGCGSRHR